MLDWFVNGMSEANQQGEAGINPVVQIIDLFLICGEFNSLLVKMNHERQIS